jgi:predicted PurR-regulated permease PerM
MSVPYVIRQVNSLVQDISANVTSFDDFIAQTNAWLGRLGLPDTILATLAQAVSNIDTYLLGLFTSVLQGLVNFSLGIFDVVIVLILTVYFMLDGVKIMQALMDNLPQKLRAAVLRVRRTSAPMTRRYIKSRILISAGMALVTYLGFTIMGIPYAFLFAVMSFILDFIPYFGSILAGLIEAVFALITGGAGLALAVLIFVLVVQQVEGNIVTPKVQGEAVGLHPITVMFALLACNKLFGPVGMLISTPIAAVVKVVFMEAYHYVVRPDDYDVNQLSM